MLIVKLLFVIISLFCNEVFGITGLYKFLSSFTKPKPVERLERSCVNISAIRTVLKPYHSQYNYVYENGSNNKGRSILTAKLVENIRAPFPSDNTWSKNNRLQRPISPRKSESDLTNSDSDDLPNDSKKYIKEDLKNASVTITSIYYNLLALICQKMNYFVHSYEFREDFENYLDYGVKTIDFINIAITELMYYHHGKQININFLLKLFYYSCGLKYTPKQDNEEIDRIAIKKKFVDYLLDYPYFYVKEMYELNEETMVKDLKTKLKLIPNKSCASFGVTISSMKMSILMEPSQEEVVRLIQSRRIKTDKITTVSDYVKYHTQRKGTDKIMTLHLNILGVLITHAFGYIYNYFELLGKLRNCGFNFDEKEKTDISQFSKLVEAYMSIFLERYFEFKGEISQKLVDSMFSIRYFLDPSDSQVEDGEELTAEEKKTLNKPIKTAYSMLSYYNISKKSKWFDKYMKDIIADAVSELLKTFNKNVPDDWNTPLKIAYEDQNSTDKDTLLNYMKKNNDDFYKVLAIFSCEFSIGKEVYDEHGLNKV